MHTISLKSDYLLVSMLEQVTYKDVLNAIIEELERVDYRNMNDIWCFDNCTLSVTYEQYDDIVKILKEKYPLQATRTKTALVASSGVTRVFLNFWAEKATTLSYEVKIFMSLEEAEAWIV